MSTSFSTAARAAPISARFAHTLVVDDREIACKVQLALTFAERGRGLIGYPRLLTGQALWIAPCPSIHTVGMQYAIDVAFLDADSRVLRVSCAVQPLRFRLCRHAVSVLELLAGQAAALGLTKGQHLDTRPPPSPISLSSLPPHQA